MSISEKDIAYAFKIIIIGPGESGKTCMFNRFCFNSFSFDTKMTIGINFHSTHLRIQNKYEKDLKQDKYILNSIFDLAGQDRFKSLIPKFITGTNGALLVFDSVDNSSFQQLDHWYELLAKNNGIKKIPIILVGSKSDLIEKTPKNKIVSENLINEFVKQKELNGFYRTSALENYNVIEVFRKITNLILKYKNIDIEI